MTHSPIVLEPDHTTPLVWFRVALRGGTATDEFGAEGAVRHAGLLACRGAAGRTRAQIDDSLDQLGAAVNVGVSRDATTFAGVCLARNLDEVMATCRDMVCQPDFTEHEHAKLVRESTAILDDLRDDDEQLAVRFFNRYVAPGHRYGRTTVGTRETLDTLRRDVCAATFRANAVSDNAVIGFAGNVDETRAARLASELHAGMGDAAAPTLPDVTAPERSNGRRFYLIDKPQRTQTQLLVGHVAPRFGTDAHAALIPVETVFGGTFTSRLTQQVRVERGWSYGAGCDLERARGDYWFSMYLAPAADVTVPALELVLGMFEQLQANGIKQDELDFAQKYLAGAMPFAVATCGQRMGVALRERLFDLPTNYREQLADKIAGLSLPEINDNAKRWLSPDNVCVVIVASAEDMLPRLHSAGFTEIEVIPYDCY